jgi:hypothetical protein
MPLCGTMLERWNDSGGMKGNRNRNRRGRKDLLLDHEVATSSGH